MPVTLKDIARACDVSFSTVSKALNNSPEISQKTIDAINKKAMELGYHPNAAAIALRTNRSYDIGVIFEDITGSGLQHQYFAKIFDSINESANRAGYDITFLSNQGKRSYLAQAKFRGCDGIIIVNSSYRRADIKELLESGIPVCTLDRNLKDTHPSVMSDNSDGFRSLMEFILGRGHRKIAFVHGEGTDVTRTRLSVFRSMLKKHGVEIPKGYVIGATYHLPETTRLATLDLLKLDDRPTCIIYPDDFSALGGIDALAKNGMMPGRDISIAGYDGIFLSKIITPRLATWEQNSPEIGRQLVAQLLSNIEYPDNFSPTSIKVSGRLVEGESVVTLS
ncbi:MAG: LacI family DNA-binding transcriptional regulator [Treponema sp.]|nr:LacI family DNA-binding transcriptional regulator [Treponema sp.]